MPPLYPLTSDHAHFSILGRYQSLTCLRLSFVLTCASVYTIVKYKRWIHEKSTPKQMIATLKYSTPETVHAQHDLRTHMLVQCTFPLPQIEICLSPTDYLICKPINYAIAYFKVKYATGPLIWTAAIPCMNPIAKGVIRVVSGFPACRLSYSRYSYGIVKLLSTDSPSKLLGHRRSGSHYWQVRA